MKKHRRGLRLAACLLTLAMCAALLCSCGRTGKTDDYTAAMPVIVVGSDNYPPFNYMGTDGAPTGIDVELATEAFGRLGYRVKFVTIDWEKKKELVENDTIDCIWGSFSMDGREEEYQWAGPYLHSRQVVAVRSDSDIYTLQDLADKVVAVQSTTKPEELFLNAEQNSLAKERGDDLPQQLTEVFQEMLADGTVRQIVSRYLDDPEHYLDGLEDSTHA